MALTLANLATLAWRIHHNTWNNVHFVGDAESIVEVWSYHRKFCGGILVTRSDKYFTYNTNPADFEETSTALVSTLEHPLTELVLCEGPYQLVRKHVPTAVYVSRGGVSIHRRRLGVMLSRKYILASIAIQAIIWVAKIFCRASQ